MPYGVRALLRVCVAVLVSLSSGCGRATTCDEDASGDGCPRCEDGSVPTVVGHGAEGYLDSSNAGLEAYPHLACTDGAALSVNLGIRGLWTNPNSLTGAPSGSLKRADNIVLHKPGTAEPRPGFPRATGQYDGTEGATRSIWFKQQLLAYFDGDTLAHWDGSNWTDYAGTFSYPGTLYRPPILESQQELFISTAEGVKSLDDPSGVWVDAGVPRALDVQPLVTSSSGQALKADANVGYRLLWAKVNANGRLKRSAPSGRVVVTGLVDPVATTPTGLSRPGGGSSVVTVETAAPHPYVVGDVVYLKSNQIDFLTGNKVVATVADTTHFTYDDGNATGAATSTGSVNFYYANRNVQITTTIPAGITTGHILEVYRTTSTVDATIDPGDTEQKSMEYIPTNADIANGYVVLLDATPDSLLQETIYTSAEIEGIGQAKEVPPVARCTIEFQGAVFYGCTRFYQTIHQLQMIATPDSTGDGSKLQFTSADRETVDDGTVYFEISSSLTEDVMAGEYQIFIGGTPAQNIYNTALSIVHVINNYPSNTILYAYYTSGADDPPGTIQFVARDHLQPAFAITAVPALGATAPNFTVPVLPTIIQSLTAGTALERTANVVTAHVNTTNGLAAGQEVTLTVSPTSFDFPDGVKVVAAVLNTTDFTYAEVGPDAMTTTESTSFTTGPLNRVKSSDGFASNRVQWSAYEQPDAVPPDNFQDLGSASLPVLQFAKIRSSLFVFKPDGLWRITGEVGDFNFEQLDPTVKLIAPESPQTVDNKVFALTDKGVAMINEQGQKQYISLPIDNLLPKLTSDFLTAKAWALGRETTKEYMLWATSSDGGEGGPQIDAAFVFAIQSGEWSRWPFIATSGTVGPSEAMDSTTDQTGYLWLVGDIMVPTDATMGGGKVPNAYGRDNREGDWRDHYDWSLEGLPVSQTLPTTTPGQVTIPLEAGWIEVGTAVLDDNGVLPAMTVTAVVVSTGLTTLTLSSTNTSTLTQASLYGPIESTIEWLPEVGGNAGVLKQWTRPAYLFRSSSFISADYQFATDILPSYESVAIRGNTPVKTVGTEAPISSDVPMAKSYGQEMRPVFHVKSGLADWELQGLRIEARLLSRKPIRR